MAHITVVVIFLSLISVHALAFSWPSRDSSPHIPDVEPHMLQDFSISDTLLDNDAIGSVENILKPYTRKPDCFRLAARRIRARCGDIELDADTRVKAAISMTLCELRTAEVHSIPVECELFLEEGWVGDHVPHSICVEALSRSTQAWASYSGYLREIPQVCSAYQQGNEKGLALEIYRNATIEKVAYIRHLMKRAEKEDESFARWQSLLVDLQRSIDDLQVSPGLLADKIYTNVTDTILNELQKVMRTQTEAFEVHLQESKERSLALSDHTRTLVASSTEFERIFSARLNAIYERLDSRLGEILTASEKMWQQVTLIESGLLSAMNLVVQLSTSASHLSDALNSSALDMKSIRVAQVNAARETARLAGTIRQMNVNIISALVEINSTAIRVNRTIGNGLNPFHPSLVSLVGATIIYLKQASLMRLVASIVVWLLWFILRQSYTFLAMPCVVAIFSLLHWFRGKSVLGKELEVSPCVCRLQGRFHSGQTSAAPMIRARAVRCPPRRPPERRSSQFSRIPDRICRGFDN